VEVDATTLRFDERGIADPLIGSVHDPIYQGAGAYGVAGIPQPKPGAVTKAKLKGETAEGCICSTDTIWLYG